MVPERWIRMRQRIAQPRRQQREHQLAPRHAPRVHAVGPLPAVVPHELRERPERNHAEHAAARAQIERQAAVAEVGRRGGGRERQPQRERTQAAVETGEQRGVAEQQRIGRRFAREADALGEHAEQVRVEHRRAVAHRELPAQRERQRLVAPATCGDDEERTEESLAHAAHARRGAELVEPDRLGRLSFRSARGRAHDVPKGNESGMGTHRGNATFI